MKPNRSHWNALLAAYAEARQYDACLGVYRRMTETAGLPPNGQSFVALLHAAKGARAGHAAAAWVLHLMREKGIPVGVEVGTALIACCRHAAPGADAKRAISLAQEVMQEMRAAQVELNIKTFNSMMLVYADVQCPAGIKSVLADLEATENVAPNEATWGIAIAAFQAAGWWDQVESAEALRDTLRTLHGMADD